MPPTAPEVVPKTSTGSGPHQARPPAGAEDPASAYDANPEIPEEALMRILRSVQEDDYALLTQNDIDKIEAELRRTSSDGQPPGSSQE